ncbi:toll/interleukin-1 receptor domain-containing protein [Paraburkholderia rhizosphaerae]|uniref:TIR domain-containing protein n=1 Tax=Paraburkholderia rhizosphaerae TaxID=480658 RepID=A0A4R8LVH6_9BURK|nr:toll/interleukin-1 receptor domain-containing protein [Paraburkholderia rhizosphaerae]TDY51820.1 TIR domain-containing protein [Paraburkholderia rhizosphaerae]
MATKRTPAQKSLPAPPTNSSPGNEDLLILSAQKPLVFISHDSRDADLAEAFANLLVDVSGGTLKSFRSSDKKGGTGIEFGTEWYNAIMSRLSEATDVVALLTQRSLDRPWILYEAGVAKGRLGTNVFGVALGVPLERVSTGPFGQFQNCGADEDSLTTLLLQLLERNPDASPREEAVRLQVSAFLKKTAEANALGAGSEVPPATDETNVAKLFEEVKAMFRELPARVDERVQSVNRRGFSRRMRRFSPSLLEELIYHPAFEKTNYGAAAAWLIVISLFKDDLSWLYESGVEFYRTLRNGSKRAIENSRNEILSILEFSTHSPVFDMIGSRESEEVHYIMHKLPEIVHRLSDRAILHAPPHRADAPLRQSMLKNIQK